MTTSIVGDGSHGPTGGQLVAGDASAVSAQVVDDGLARLYEFFVEHYSEILAMPRTFATARQGLALVAEPHELANTVLSRLADKLISSASRAELTESLDKYCRLGYIYRCLENENNDRARRERWIRPLTDRPEQLAGFRAVDPPPSQDDGEDRRNLKIVLDVLRQRATATRPPATCLTQLHVRCWQAVVDGRGAQAALAKELNVDPSRITQIKASATAKVHEALYVAGVLGQPGTLGDARRVEACLDIYDTTQGADRTHSTEQRARLATAAPTVRVDPAAGQRADHRAAANRYLRRKDKRELREAVAASSDQRERFEADFAESLHLAESTQACAVHNPYPNCALNCTAHNPTQDRVIWQIVWT